MSFLLKCPRCGARDAYEFRFGGELECGWRTAGGGGEHERSADTDQGGEPDPDKGCPGEGSTLHFGTSSVLRPYARALQKRSNWRAPPASRTALILSGRWARAASETSDSSEGFRDATGSE